MKREHKIGLAITSTFLCLVGAVIGLKMQDRIGTKGSEPVASKDNDAAGKGKSQVLVPNLTGTPPPGEPLSQRNNPSPLGSGGQNNDGKTAKNNDPGNENGINSDEAWVLGFNSDTIPRIQPPADPSPTAVNPATGPARTKEPQLVSSDFAIAQPAPMDGGNHKPKVEEKLLGPTVKANDPKKPSPGDNIPAGKEGPSINIPLVSAENQGAKKGTGIIPLSSGSVPPSGVSNPAEKATESTSAKDKSKDVPPLTNQLSAPFLPGSPLTTGAAAKPPTPTPTASPSPTMILTGSPQGAAAPSPPPPEPPPTAPELGMGAGAGAQPKTSKNLTTGPTPIAPSGLSPTPIQSGDNKGNSLDRGNLSLMDPDKTPVPKVVDNKAAPLPTPGGGDPNAAKAPASPSPPSPWLMGQTVNDKSTPAPPSPPPAPAGKPLDKSYFILDPQTKNGTPPGPLPSVMPDAPKPIGTTGMGSLRPVAANVAPAPPKPIASPRPEVIVYDEQEYRAAAGDTFAGISKRFYGTEAFAEALRRHNRHHARASMQMTNNGTLAPGERLYIPPADILEQRYGDTIAKKSSAPPAAPASFPAPAPPSGQNRSPDQ